MNQAKRHSFIESIVNVLVGYGVAVLCNLWVLPLFGFNVSWHDSALMAVLFTVVSVVRSYLLRRLFNIYT